MVYAERKFYLYKYIQKIRIIAELFNFTFLILSRIIVFKIGAEAINKKIRKFNRLRKNGIQLMSFHSNLLFIKIKKNIMIKTNNLQ